MCVCVLDAIAHALPSTAITALYWIAKSERTLEPSEQNDTNTELALLMTSRGRSFPHSFISCGAVVSLPSNTVMQSVLPSSRTFLKYSQICCKTSRYVYVFSVCIIQEHTDAFLLEYSKQCLATNQTLDICQKARKLVD